MLISANLFRSLIIVPCILLATAGCSRQDPVRESRKLVQEFDYQRAAATLDQVISKDSTNVDAIALRVRIYSLSNDTAALRATRSSYENSGNPFLIQAVAQTYYHARYFDKADSLFQQIKSIPGFVPVATHWIARVRIGATADSIYDVGYAFLERGENDSALAFFSMAKDLWAEIGHEEALATAFQLIAFTRAAVGDLSGADEDARKSYDLARTTGDRSQVARALSTQGVIADRKGDFHTAIGKLERASQLAQEDRNVRLQIVTRGNLSLVQMRFGDTEGATKSSLEIVELSKNLGILRSLNIAYLTLGNLNKDAGRFADAVRYYDSSMTLARQRQDRHIEAASLDELSNVYMFRNQYEDALKLRRQSLAVHKALRDRRNETLSLEAIANLYTFIGEHDRALALIREATAIAREIQAEDLMLSLEFRKAQVYLSLRDYRSSMEVCERLLPRVRRMGDYQLSSSVVLLFENARREGKLRASSDAELDSLMTDAERRGFTHTAATARLSLAKLALEQDNVPRSTALLEQLLRSPEIRESPELAAGAHDAHGDLLLRLRRQPDAMTAYRQALATLESIEDGLIVAAHRAAYAERLRKLFEKQVFLAHEQSLYDTLFQLVERARARSFLSLFLRRGLQPTDSVNSALIELERGLRANIATAHQALATTANGPESADRTRSVNLISENVRKATEEYSQFLYGEELNNSRLNSILAVPTIRVADIQALIPHDAMLLHSTIFGERMILCALRDRGPLKVFSIPSNREKLRDNVRLLRAQMHRKRLGETAWKKLAVHLEQVLFDSVKASGLLENVRTIMFVPDDVLYYLPIGLLSDGERFLAERFAIVNYPSAGVMKLLDGQLPRQHKRSTVLAMAYSDGTIPFAEAEVRAIHAGLGSAVHAVIGNAATVDTLAALAPRYDIVHLAAHGVPYHKDPLLSALLLAPTKRSSDRGHDGRLFVHDVFNLKLQNALVVLSGCETGVERSYQTGISPGGEVIGLTRAFLFAGAGGVVSTLWKVDDESSMEFMRRFYGHLQTLHEPAVAVQRAQHEMLSVPRWQHPYYWAAYVVTGK